MGEAKRRINAGPQCGYCKSCSRFIANWYVDKHTQVSALVVQRDKKLYVVKPTVERVHMPYAILEPRKYVWIIRCMACHSPVGRKQFPYAILTSFWEVPLYEELSEEEDAPDSMLEVRE